MSFFVVLTSEDSTEFFPENSASHFQVKLPQGMPFANTGCEVGLSEVHTCVNNNTEFYFSVKHNGIYFKQVIVRNSCRGVSLVNCINESLTAEMKKVVSFHYNEKEDQFMVRLKQNTELDICLGLAAALGFECRKLVQNVNKSSIKPLPYNSNEGEQDIILTCDIIKPQLLSSKFVKHLRLLPKIDPNKDFSANFLQPFFMPIEHDAFHVMRFAICKPNGQVLKISGKTTLVLQFRLRH